MLGDFLMGERIKLVVFCIKSRTRYNIYNIKHMMGNNWGYGSGYMHNVGYMGFGLGWLLFLIFWVIVIAAIVWAVKWMFGGGAGYRHKDMPQEDSALKILKERYARGEISKEEFENKKKDLLVR